MWCPLRFIKMGGVGVRTVISEVRTWFSLERNCCILDALNFRWSVSKFSPRSISEIEIWKWRNVFKGQACEEKHLASNSMATVASLSRVRFRCSSLVTMSLYTWWPTLSGRSEQERSSDPKVLGSQRTSETGWWDSCLGYQASSKHQLLSLISVGRPTPINWSLNFTMLC